MKLSGYLRHVTFFPASLAAPEPHAIAEAELGEAYAGLYFDSVDLRIGNLLFAWGATPGLSPSDVLNPMDLRFGLAAALGGTEGKRPVPAVEMRLFSGETSLTLVVLPLFVPNRVALFGYDWGLAGAGVLLPMPLPDPRGFGYDQTGVDQVQPFFLHTRLPRPVPENWQFAARAEARLGPVDLGLVALDAYDPFPRQRIDPDLQRILIAEAEGDTLPLDAALAVGEKIQKGEALFEAWHVRRQLVAADIEWPAGDLLLRGDLGYSPLRTLYAVTESDLDPGRRSLTWTAQPVLSGAAGGEYLDLEGLTFGLSAYLFAALDVPGDRVLVGFEDTRGFPARLPADGRAVLLYGALAYGRTSFFDETLEVTAALLYQISTGGLLILPTVTYRASDHHRFSLSAEILGGPEWGLFGAFDHNDRVGLVWTAAF
ncbi:MAG: hypothetical protein D6729_12805 [Deltaproteobacteria bacterium]|nr:MAG: hypothetical protein D6729_12805 [Deltaproteobacteria bacterium]